MAKQNEIKISLTRKEVITLAGILGAMYGETLHSVYEELIMHLAGEDENIADEISALLDQAIVIDEDSLLYEATVNIKGAYSHD